MLDEPIVLRKEEEDYKKKYETQLKSLENFFDQVVELLQKEEKYSGCIKHKTKSRTRGSPFGDHTFVYLTIVQEIPRSLRSSGQKCILAFNMSEWMDYWDEDFFRKKGIIIDIYDTEKYEELANLLEPIAKDLSRKMDISVILNKQPNIPITVS